MKPKKPKIRKPISLRAGKRETPKTVYNRKHLKDDDELMVEAESKPEADCSECPGVDDCVVDCSPTERDLALLDIRSERV